MPHLPTPQPQERRNPLCCDLVICLDPSHRLEFGVPNKGGAHPLASTQYVSVRKHSCVLGLRDVSCLVSDRTLAALLLQDLLEI